MNTLKCKYPFPGVFRTGIKNINVTVNEKSLQGYIIFGVSKIVLLFTFFFKYI